MKEQRSKVDVEHPSVIAARAMSPSRRECLPYKPTVFLSLFFTFLAFIFFHVVAFSCDTFKIKTSALDDEETQWVSTIGFWSAEVPSKRGCVEFSKMDDLFSNDGWFRLGQNIALWGAALAWWVLGVMALASVRRVPAPQTFRKCLAFMMFVMACLSLLVMVALASDSLETFELGTGAKVGIASSVMWVVAGISLFYCFQELDDPFLAQAHESVTEIA